MMESEGPQAAKALQMERGDRDEHCACLDQHRRAARKCLKPVLQSPVSRLSCSPPFLLEPPLCP